MQKTEVHRHVPQKDFYSVSDAASLLQISKNKVYELANRGLDPLPFRRLTDMPHGSYGTHCTPMRTGRQENHMT